MMNTAKRFFGNHMMFTVERTPGGTARTYTRFTDVVRDTIDARIYLGIHFRTADVDGAILGKNVARLGGIPLLRTYVSASRPLMPGGPRQLSAHVFAATCSAIAGRTFSP